MSIVQATARALADAVARSEVLCESDGEEADTEACGFAQADVEVIARAQVCCFHVSGDRGGGGSASQHLLLRHT